MNDPAGREPTLSCIRSAIAEAYGDRLERLVLFGSRARGEAHEGSDYDVAVFLIDLGDRAVEMNRLADIGTSILYEQGSVVHAMPYGAGAYNDRTPLMHEIRRDGIDL